MYRPIVFFIGFRYVFKYSIKCFYRFMSWLSAIGIMIGVMSLIIVISIMNSFEHELENNILKVIPQLIITSKNGYFNPKKLSENKIKLSGITDITPISIGNVILFSDSIISMGVMLGIDQTKKDPLDSYLTNIKRNKLIPGKYNLIIGKRLAERLNVHVGNQLRVVMPSTNYITPIGSIPNQKLFNIIGTYFTNSEIDYYQVIVNIQDASIMIGYPLGNITGWRLWLKNPLKINLLNYSNLPKEAIHLDWRKHKGELFQALCIEKNIMTILLSMIIIIALFNTITLLSITVLDKNKEIAILKTQGLTTYQIMCIFIIQGCSIGIIGSVLGSILGVLVASKLNFFMFIINLIIDCIPLSAIIKPEQIFSIFLLTIIVIVLSTIYPAWYASQIKPAKILRHG